MKKAIFILLLILCVGAYLQAQHITPVQLPDPKDFGGGVHCIFQDKFGLIWIGKDIGLFRYDGNELKIFKNDPSDPNSISSNNVLSLADDPDGNLWVGTKGGGLNFYNRATGRFTRFLHNVRNPASLSFDEVYCLKPAGKGNLWIGTDGGGLNYYNRQTGKFKIINSPDKKQAGFKSDKILSIEAAGKGKYWIGTWNGGISLFDPVNNQIKHIGDNTPFANINVFCIKKMAQNILWIATWGHGLIDYNIQTGKFSTLIQPSVIPKTRKIVVGAHGDIWVASLAGLLHFKSISSDYEIVKGVAGSFAEVSDVYIDRSGLVWVGSTIGALGKVNMSQKNFKTVPEKYPFSRTMVRAVSADKSNRQVYFSSGNLLIRYTPETKAYKTYKFSAGELISMVDRPQSNYLLCATLNKLFSFNKLTGVFEPLKFASTLPPGLAEEPIHSLHIIDGETCWVGARGVGYQLILNTKNHLWNVGKVLYAGKKGSISQCHIASCFLFDKNKTLWVGTLGGGINRSNSLKNSFRFYLKNSSDSNSISDNMVECMINDNQGNLLIGTQAGLNSFDIINNTFRSFKISNGLQNDWITALAVDSKNRIWASTQNGISTLSSDRKHIRNFDFDDGLPANSFRGRSVTTDHRGNIYFGSIKGLVWFHPDSIKSSPNAPEPLLVDFTIRDEKVIASEDSPLKQSIETAKEIKLKDNQNVFSFQIAALNYANPKKIRIKYKLAGYDDDWKLAGKDQIAAYYDVPSGKYTFSYMVSNEDGIWSNKEKTVDIIIRRPLWLSFWAIVLYIIFLSAGAFYVYRLSLRIRLLDSVKSLNIQYKQPKRHDLIEPAPIVLEPADTRFLQKALLIVEENISDSDFGVDQLCDKMNLSRSQLYRKINSLAGVSVSEFIKEVRLKRAAQLILQKVATISEIAYQVGFSDPKYFGKCFKKQFGVSPAHYTVQNESTLP